MLKLFRDLFRRTRPRARYNVKVQIWNELNQRYIGQFILTTDASSRAEAKQRIQACLQMHVTEAWAVKEKVNGSH